MANAGSYSPLELLDCDAMLILIISLSASCMLSNQDENQLKSRHVIVSESLIIHVTHTVPHGPSGLGYLRC